MSDFGGSVADDYGEERDDEISDDNLSNQQSDSPQEDQMEDQEVPNSEDEDENDQQSEPMNGRISIIEGPVFTEANKQRITPPFLTKYQKARVIGVRAMQISKNSPLYLNADDKDLSHWDPLFIAEKELAEQKIPFIIRRHLPDSSYEDWELSELKSLD